MIIDRTSVYKCLSFLHEIRSELIRLEKLRETDRRQTASTKLEVRATTEENDQNRKINEEPIAY